MLRLVNINTFIQMHNAQLAGRVCCDNNSEICSSIGRQYHHNDGYGWGRKRIPYNTNNDLMFNEKKNYKPVREQYTYILPGSTATLTSSIKFTL